MNERPPAPDQAFNGLQNRRHFLSKAAAVLSAIPVGAAAASREDLAIESSQTSPGELFTNYGMPATEQRHVVRWISNNDAAPGNGISWTPLHELDGVITPNGLHYERHHNGIPALTDDQHELTISGMVERPLAFDVAALLRYPRQSRICFIECGGNSNAAWRKKPVQTPAGFFHGLISCSEWTGVPLSDLLEESGLKTGATWAVAEGADAFSLTMSIPLDKLLDDCLVAMFQNGERIRPSQGYPMRLLVPGWEGVYNVKWLKNIVLSDKPAMSRNETSRYTELQADGRARQFTFTMAPKSLITNPSAEMALPAHGFYELTGLAWSGHGRVAKVEVSADGGQSWLEAELNAPVLPKCMTRFRIPWHWSGQTAVLQSRVTDEFGNQQPSRKTLLERHGRHGYFHYNGIVSWAVDTSGRVTHTYPDAQQSGDENDPFGDLFMDDKWD